jgi:ribosomal protein L7/L12
MDTTTLLIIGAAAIFGIIFVLFLRRLGGASSPGYTELTPLAAPPVRLDPAAESELREMVARGQKIEAIKRARELTGLGLKEAKDYVELLPRIAMLVAVEPSAEARADEREVEREARALLASGDTIAAVKRVCELTGWGLKESREYVQSLSPTLPGSASLSAETLKCGFSSPGATKSRRSSACAS